MSNKIANDFYCGPVLGTSAVLSLYEDKIVVKNKYKSNIFLTIFSLGIAKLMELATNTEKIIFYNDITSVAFRNTSSIFGVLFITVAGGGIGISFQKEQKNEANNIVAIINKKIDEIKLANQNIEYIHSNELINLKKLLDNGVITQADFDAKKKQLLGL